jgi:hypothetical protein
MMTEKELTLRLMKLVRKHSKTRYEAVRMLLFTAVVVGSSGNDPVRDDEMEKLFNEMLIGVHKGQADVKAGASLQ